MEKLDRDKIIEQTSRRQPFEWQFNSPAAPHFGGVFEDVVKSAKNHLIVGQLGGQFHLEALKKDDAISQENDGIEYNK